MGNFGSQRVTMPCPGCGATFKVSPDQIVRQATVTCPNGHHVKLVDQGHGFRKISKSLDNFKRSFKK